MRPQSSTDFPSLPTRFLIRASRHAALMLSPSGSQQAEVEKSLIHVPTEGVYGSEDLRRGLDLLSSANLVIRKGIRLVPTHLLIQLRTLDSNEYAEAFLAIYMTALPPIWLYTAVGVDSVSFELIPDHDLDVIRTCIDTSEGQESLITAVAGRLDPEAAAELGVRGEEFVADELRVYLKSAGRADLALRVQRVSLVSDSLGYDIVAPNASGGFLHLEVKSTRASGHHSVIFVTRNEARRARLDPFWYLVVCHESGGKMELAGWCCWQTISSLLPSDPKSQSHSWGKWETVKIVLYRELLRAGLPPML